MPQRTRRPKTTETAGETRVPLNPQREIDMFLTRMAEESGDKSMKAVGKRMKKGIRAALKAGKSDR